MTTEQMNEYIMNYLENDKTKRAIMLDGPWGSGKSFYIKEKLTPYLRQNRLDIIIVSLYGLTSLSEISFNIFLEAKRLSGKWLKNIGNHVKKYLYDMHGIEMKGSNEGNPARKIIAKTIIKSVASHYNIDIRLSETDLRRLYKTVDLTNKLVVLEDLERSGIPILDVLGYVNNLTEQDGAKVLLVVNEEEITKEKEIEKENNTNNETNKLRRLASLPEIPQQEIEISDQAKLYLRSKEKTVGDTIKFVCNKEETIKNIFDTVFSNNKHFDELRDEKIIKELADTMTDDNCNWRSFLYACQKTIDIIDKYEKNNNVVPLNPDFKKEIFKRTVRYCLKKDGGMNEKQLKDERLKQKEYYNKTDYDFIDFVIEYIINQKIDIEEIQKANNLYIHINSNTKKNNEFHEAFRPIEHWYISNDIDIIDSLHNIKNLLESKSGINLYFYGELLQRLVYIKYYMKKKEFTDIIDECIPLMVNNIEKMSKEELYQYDEFMWSSRFKKKEEALAKEYEKCWKEIAQKIREKQLEKIDINYTHNNFTQFVDSLKMIKDKLYTDFCFLKKLDIDKFLLLLGECSAKEIETIRFVFPTYDERTIVNDKQYLQQLRKGIKDILEKDLQSSQRVQLNWFLDNLPNVDVEEVSAN